MKIPEPPHQELTQAEVEDMCGEYLRFEAALIEEGYDPKDFVICFNDDDDTVTVTRKSNGVAKTYPRHGRH